MLNNSSNFSVRINPLIWKSLLITSLILLILLQSINIPQVTSSSSLELGILDETANIEIEEPFAICHGHGNTLEDAQNLSDIGVQMTRNDIYWAGIEQESGVYDFSRFDTFYSNINVVGVEPLAILDYGNNRLFPDTDGRIIQQEHLPAWIDFVNVTVRRFMDKITYWEIWNEPNLDKFWSGTDEEFFHILNVTMRLIKEINPNLKVLGPGISGHDPEYLDAMINFIGDVDFNEFIDILNFHPYSGSSAEEVRYKSKEVWEIVKNHNFTGEVWITEVGRSTQVSSNDNKEEQPYEHSIQAREIIKAYTTALGENISKIVWYCYGDWWNINWTYGEAAFGIIYREDENAVTWSTKPSGYLYKKLSDKLSHSTYYPNAIVTSGFKFGSVKNDYHYYFKTSYNSSIMILWSQSAPYNVKLSNENIKSAYLHSLFDDMNYTLDIDDLNFELNEWPLFIEIFWDDDLAQNIGLQQKAEFTQIFAFIIGPIIFFIGVIIVIRNKNEMT